jgi:hypothetical protein
MGSREGQGVLCFENTQCQGVGIDDKSSCVLRWPRSSGVSLWD